MACCIDARCTPMKVAFGDPVPVSSLVPRSPGRLWGPMKRLPVERRHTGTKTFSLSASITSKQAHQGSQP